MAQSERGAHHRALAAFVTEHRDQLEAYANSGKETAWLAEALLNWDQADKEAAAALGGTQ